MGAGSRRIRAALAIACIVAVCPRGAAAAGRERGRSTRLGTATAAPAADPPRASRLPLQFEEGSGDRGRKTFVARGPGYDLTVTAAAALTLRKTGQADAGTLRMTLSGARPASPMVGLDALPGKVYHATSTSRGILSGNPAFRRIKSTDVYPGIDVVYYGNERHLEFDFLVAPRRDVKQIRLAFSGADRITLGPDGELALRVNGEDVRLKKPIIYQERAGVREPVAGGYRMLDAARRQVGFQVGAYDRSRPLVIDPMIVFATYRGGTDAEQPRRIEVNALGEVYLFADSRDPSTLPPHQGTQTVPLAPPQPGFGQCFLTKLSPDGRTAFYTVIFEGAQCQAMTLGPEDRPDTRKIHLQVGTSFHYQRTLTESPTNGLTLEPLQGAYDVCVIDQGSCGPVEWMRADSEGNVYFIMQYTPVGMTPPDFVYELRKIDTQGQLAGSLRLIQPPIYASPGGNFVHDQITGLEVDNGSVYVIGYGASPGIVTPTANALLPAKPSGNSCPDPLAGTCYDGFVLRIQTTEAPFEVPYASYLGGVGDDRPFGAAWDRSSQTLYVAGTTTSSNFPTTPGSYFSGASQAGQNGFLVNLNLGAGPAQQLRFGTLLPDTSPTAVAVLPGGMAAVAGQATDFNCGTVHCFRLVNSLYPSRFALESRPFMSVLSADGAALRFSSFLDATGGAGSFLTSVATNGSPIVYTALATEDGALGTPGALQPSNRGGTDALVQAIDLTGIAGVTDPPSIAFTPAVVNVAATDPVGGTVVPLICGRLFACTIDDPDGDVLTHVTWYGPNGFRASTVGGLPAPADADVVPRAYASLPPGTHAFTLVARDESGAIGTGTLTVNVASVNTIPGPLQTVVLTDSKFIVNENGQGGSEHPVSVTFDNVTAPGLTWLESRWDLLPPPPTALQAGSPPYYYEIKSNAAFSGTVRVCVNVRGMSLAREQAELQLYQLVSGSWTALTGQSAPSSDEICAEAPGLGTFAILYPPVAETTIAAIAGTGFAEHAIDGPGGDPRDEFRDQAPALQSTLTRPGQLALMKSGQAHKLLVADNGYQFGARIRMLDLATGEIGAFLEPNECYGFGPLAVDPTGQFFYCVRPDPQTGQVDIYRFDDETGLRRYVTSAPEVLAMVTDADGNLFYSDGNIHRVPAAGGDSSLVFAFNNSQLALSLPYFDRAWTLAFDAEGHLLAGGNTLVRISPGDDGLVNGTSDETAARIAGILGTNVTGYAQPFSGDGLPALQARLNFSYQMIVASDGAVVFTDEIQRIRRIAPGADGVVNGGADEIVRTVAGFLSPVPAAPTGFATSYWAQFRGLAENPLEPGSFIVSSHLGHQLLQFGIAPTGEPPLPPPPGPAIVAITEQITVDDGIVILPSAFIALTENIAVDDGIAILPSAMIALTEAITVDDGITVLPSVMIAITESVVVNDGIVAAATAPPAVLQLAVTPILRQDENGQYIAAVTVRNAAITSAEAVQLTTAILNATPAASLPIQVGTIAPGAQVALEVTFAGTAGVAGTSGTLRLTFAWTGRSVSISQRVPLPAPLPALWGWADLHTHPMSNLAFGGKLFHGAPDVGSLMPAVQMASDPQCRFDNRAISIAEALSDDAPTHGDPIQSKCGDALRNLAVQALEEANDALRQPGHAVGYPTFTNWPRWNDITHQKMWVDWIRRAKDGGLRVLVALSHNNRTLAEPLGAGGPISGVKDDRASSDLQVEEIKTFVGRHPDLMKVAVTPTDLYQTVQDGKIAILLGVELDNIGDFNDLPVVNEQIVEAEIDRLYAQGVRYIFPVHLTDNRFGDSAIYSVMFNIANRRETGAFWTVGCAAESEEVAFKSFNFPPVLNPFIPPGFPSPPTAPDCLLAKPGGPFFTGNVNARTAGGLTPLGRFAVKAMMKRGMIVDVDHMSNAGVETALGIAEAVQPGGGYPLVSGHSAIRDRNSEHFNAENSRSRTQLQRIGCLQGMFGLGTDGAQAYDWASQYLDAFSEMGKPTTQCPDKSALGKGRVAFGTDTNSLVRTPRPTMVEVKPGTVPRFTDIYNPNNPANDNPQLPVQAKSTTGTRTWDYNFDGVAHYGMYADFVKDVRTAPVTPLMTKTGKDLVDNHLLKSADYFFRMWQKIDSQKINVR